MAYIKKLSIGVDVDFHLGALKFKWPQLQDAHSCSKGGIRGWWEGVKGFRRGVCVCVCVDIGRPSYPPGRPPFKATDPFGVARALLPGPRIPHRVPAQPPWLLSPRDATRAGGTGSAGASLKVFSAHLAQLGALAFLPPRFCSHSCVHSARDPPSDP